MAKGKDEDEVLPTPEQAQAYAERAQAAIALARFDKFCAGLPASSLASHASEHGCLMMATLGQSIAIVEYGTSVGLAVPPIHANWIEDFPFDFIAVTRSELFFVSKGFSWLGAEIPQMGISLGYLLPTTMLARLCNQKTVSFFMVRGPLATASEGSSMRDGRPVLVYQVPDGIEVLKTRQHFEKLAHNSRTDLEHVVQEHFLG